MLHSMAVLEQDMKLEVVMCLVLHNTIVLVWAMGKSNHTAEETSVAYTSEVNKKGKSQQAMELADDALEASN